MILLLVALHSAHAHHDAAVTQVGPRTELGAGLESAVEEPTLRVSAGYDLRAFSRTLRGSEPRPQDASVTVHETTLGLGYELPAGTALSLVVPVGVVTTRSPAGTEHLAGLADMRIAVRHRLGPAFAHVGMTAPTGRTATNSSLSLTDVSGEDGEVRITTYDTRASLGSGAWTASAATGVAAETDRIAVHGRLGAAIPLTRTPDDIRWGTTVDGRLGGRATLVAERLVAGLDLTARHHLADRMDVLDEDTGKPTAQRSGERTSIGLSTSVVVALSDRSRVGIDASLPLWQHVDGVQLVESASLGLTWTRRWGLSARP